MANRENEVMWVTRRFVVVMALLMAAVACGATDDPAAEPAAPVATPSPAVEAPDTVDVPHDVVPYGDLESQFGQLWLPDEPGPVPVVILVHGGFWLEQFRLDLMEPLAADLVQRGHAVWNIEYRRVGPSGGGWPTTFDDVADAVDHLAVIDADVPLDLDRVSIVGHSAGGHLALWAASRSVLPDDSPWADPEVSPILAVGQAPVANLVLAATEGAGGGAVQAFLGGEPDEVPDRYRAATPSDDMEAEVLIVQGLDDDIVLERWATVGPRTTAGLVLLENTDHFDVIDPTHPAWAAVVDALAASYE